MSFTLTNDGCDFFLNTEFETEPWYFDFIDNSTLEISTEGERVEECTKSGKTFSCNKTVEAELGDGAVLASDGNTTLTMDKDSVSGTQEVLYRCAAGSDCLMEQRPCEIAFAFNGSLMEDE